MWNQPGVPKTKLKQHISPAVGMELDLSPWQGLRQHTLNGTQGFWQGPLLLTPSPYALSCSLASSPSPFVPVLAFNCMRSRSGSPQGAPLLTSEEQNGGHRKGEIEKACLKSTERSTFELEAVFLRGSRRALLHPAVLYAVH